MGESPLVEGGAKTSIPDFELKSAILFEKTGGLHGFFHHGSEGENRSVFPLPELFRQPGFEGQAKVLGGTE
jgi:hypothetical protein